MSEKSAREQIAELQSRIKILEAERDSARQQRAYLKEDLQAMRDEQRICGCGYCGTALHVFPNTPPTEQDLQEASDKFARHDRMCEKNPVRKERDNWRTAANLLKEYVMHKPGCGHERGQV